MAGFPAYINEGKTFKKSPARTVQRKNFGTYLLKYPSLHCSLKRSFEVFGGYVSQHWLI